VLDLADVLAFVLGQPVRVMGGRPLSVPRPGSLTLAVRASVSAPTERRRATSRVRSTANASSDMPKGMVRKSVRRIVERGLSARNDGPSSSRMRPM
jgi:hypothetical protein